MPRTGIPALERFVGRILVTRWARQNPPERAAGMLRAQQRDLLELIRNAGEHALTRVQIKRMRGLEQSSTNYSLVMIADHLARVNHDLALTLADLARNQPSPIEALIAKYKPDPDALIAPALLDLDRSITALESVLADPGAFRRATMTHAHPWFGHLPAAVWACFAPFHQALHLRQARAVVAAFPAVSAAARERP